MPIIDKKPFKPNPIPDNVKPDDDVFYLDLTNEIFTSHDAFMDRYLFCNSLVWTCGRTGKSGLTYKEALDSEQSQNTAKKKKKPGRKPASASQDDETNNSLSRDPSDTSKVKSKNKSDTSTNPNNNTGTTTTTTSNNENGDNGDQPPVKKKKKKYPYDPKKYSMPVPEGFDPSLLTPTGKIDGRKLKSKKNKTLAEELLSTSIVSAPKSPGKKGKKSKKMDETKRKEDEAKRKEEESKKKAQMQAELAKERELEAKRKKEAAALARQLERQKKDEERKKAAAWLANWEKKCEDLERDDLRRLPQPTPVNCDLPERLFGDAIFIMEAIYNFHDLYNFSEIYPDGMMSFDTLEEILIDKQEEGALGTLLMFLLKTIFFTQPTKDGYGLDDDSTIQQQQHHQQPQPQDSTRSSPVEINANSNMNGKDDVKMMSENDEDDVDRHSHDRLGGSEADEEDEEEEEDDKYNVNMNDLIGSAIKAAQEIKKSFNKPLPEMELTPQNVTEILRLHLLQSGSFPKGRTIYNGWYSSREDPGLWLCMQEPDLIKKLGEDTVYDLEIEERIKVLHTLIYQLLTFIKSRVYMEMASDQLTELRKSYRKEAADYARWDRENCVKRMQPPKRKNDQQVGSTSTFNATSTTNNTHTSDKTTSNQADHHQAIKPSDHSHQNGNGGTNHLAQHTQLMLEGDDETMIDEPDANHKASNELRTNLKSCLKSNGTNNDVSTINNNNNNDNDPESGAGQHQQAGKKKITFKTAPNTSNTKLNGAIDENGGGGGGQQQQDEDDDVDMKMEPIGGHNSHDDDEVKNLALVGGDQEQSYEELERAYQQNTVDYEDYQREKAIRLEQLNQTLLDIRINLRNNQSVYAVHPIGRDRAYRRYWLFQSLPGLFIEQEDEFVGKCLPSPTPLESRYKKLFGKDNPLMHPNEADLIRTKTCDVACSTEPIDLMTTQTTTTTTSSIKNEPNSDDLGQAKEQHDPQDRKQEIKQEKPDTKQQEAARTGDQHQVDMKDENQISDRLVNGGALVDGHDGGEQEATAAAAAVDSLITDEMNYCTGDEESCLIHGKKRTGQPKWWFYHQPDSIDRLIESLNRRGHRESELHDILAAESSILKPRIAECPAYKLNKDILEQSGIRRSRRLRVKGSKRRGRKDYD